MMNTRTLKLKNHPSAQCHITVYEDGSLDFISYSTLVIRAVPFSMLDGMYTLACSGLYSRTTIRQISWFMSEFFGFSSYQKIKDIAGTENTTVAQLTRKLEG